MRGTRAPWPSYFCNKIFWKLLAHRVCPIVGERLQGYLSSLLGCAEYYKMMCASFPYNNKLLENRGSVCRYSIYWKSKVGVDFKHTEQFFQPWDHTGSWNLRAITVCFAENLERIVEHRTFGHMGGNVRSAVDKVVILWLFICQPFFSIFFSQSAESRECRKSDSAATSAPWATKRVTMSSCSYRSHFIPFTRSFSPLSRHPWLPVSGRSQLHHQHEGAELPAGAPQEIQGPLGWALPQGRLKGYGDAPSFHSLPWQSSFSVVTCKLYQSLAEAE